MHPRQTIINQTITLLTGIAGLPTPKEIDEQPAAGSSQPIVRVGWSNETSARSKSEMEDERKLRLEIHLAAPRKPGFQTALNAMAELVEAKLGANPKLNDTADSLEYLGATPDPGEVADVASAEMMLSYEASYIYTPTVTADTFGTLNVQIDMAGPRNDPQLPATPDGQIDASATVILPT